MDIQDRIDSILYSYNLIECAEKIKEFSEDLLRCKNVDRVYYISSFYEQLVQSLILISRSNENTSSQKTFVLIYLGLTIPDITTTEKTLKSLRKYSENLITVLAPSRKEISYRRLLPNV